MAAGPEAEVVGLEAEEEVVAVAAIVADEA